MSEKEMSVFLKRAYELGKVKDVSEAFKEFDPKEEIHKGDPNFFVKEDKEKYYFNQ